MMAEQLTILIIEGEETLRKDLRLFFEASGSEVLEAGDGICGLTVFRERRPAVVLADLKMQGISGLDLIHTLAEEAPGTPVVAFSEVGAIEESLNAVQMGAWDFVTLPIADMRQLFHVVKRVLERARLLDENRRYRDQLTDSQMVEKALRESEERYRDLVENINDVVFSVDINGRITFVSPVVETLFGYRPEEIIGQSYRD
ncbi:MAG TPA: response regulator, partial [Syntrophobacteraceae bacterium]|nr:response regulator [Syntrophobacteraceae bacterium]